MKTKVTFLVAGVVSVMALSAPPVKAAGLPLTITDLSGTVRIQQGLPCGQSVEIPATIQEGRMDLTTSSDVRARSSIRHASICS